MTANTINAWNTGRKYTYGGQRIAWTVISSSVVDGFEQCRVSFADCDRSIDGVVTVFEEPALVRNADVLRAYDHGGYEWDTNQERVSELYAAARAID